MRSYFIVPPTIFRNCWLCEAQVRSTVQKRSTELNSPLPGSPGLGLKNKTEKPQTKELCLGLNPPSGLDLQNNADFTEIYTLI